MNPCAIRNAIFWPKKIDAQFPPESLNQYVAWLKVPPEKQIDLFTAITTLQSDLASLLGDTSEITPEPLKSRMLQKTKAMFDRLLIEAEGQPKEAYYPFNNEYYFRFAKYHEQYELGIERINAYWGTDSWDSMGVKGYYCQGVGATYYAKQLLMQGKKQQALAWVQKALVAWAQYFSYTNDYYNAYVHYALALGILGYKEEMMRALERSASLIKKDLNYHEFQEVIQFIDEINRT